MAIFFAVDQIIQLSKKNCFHNAAAFPSPTAQSILVFPFHFFLFAFLPFPSVIIRQGGK